MSFTYRHPDTRVIRTQEEMLDELLSETYPSQGTRFVLMLRDPSNIRPVRPEDEEHFKWGTLIDRRAGIRHVYSIEYWAYRNQNFRYGLDEGVFKRLARAGQTLVLAAATATEVVSPMVEHSFVKM